MSLTDFWKAIDFQIDDLEEQKPKSAAAVFSILGGTPPVGISPGKAFFAGSGGDRGILRPLENAGWRIVWIEAAYFWCIRHPETGDKITYVEGDLYEGNHAATPTGEAE
jgi:hypothetical protein